MQKRINKYIFTGLLIGVAAVFLFLTNLIYNLTLEDAKKNHQLQQLEMAKVVSEGTKYFLYHLVKDMELLTTNAGLAERREKEFNQILEHFRFNYDETIISSIIIVNNNSGTRSVSGEVPPLWVYPVLDDLITDITGLGKDYKFLVSDVYPDDPLNLQSDKSFLILIPVPNASGSYISFLVNFDSLIKYFIVPLKLSSNDFVWILDGSGRLIYHPRHQEMLFNSIFDLQDDCRSCHISFEDQIKVVHSSEADYGEYWVRGDEPSKIFAYVPLQLENQRWNIAISTLLPDVTKGLQERFRLFFILGILILITLLSFVIIIYFLNLKRIKSEEEKKNLEKIRDYQEQLNHSSKLASIGELVDSVAHELNTPMGIIAAHADSIMLQGEQQPAVTEGLEIIRKQTRRISDYTRTLLNFSKRMAFNPEELELIPLIEESLYLLAPRIREKRIRINNKTLNKRIVIKGDPRQLEQVFINILSNAIDAAKENGIINIDSTEKVKKSLLPDSDPVGHVKISISDNGIGINKDDLKNIFDPFFTTKAGGTGLGLSIARSIIQRHKGIIEVDSKEGKGTVFSIMIPGNLRSEDE
jgi:signal transduction histidine kinase